jgi:pimeloyl-ACP methyl ester carboxylesterase
MDAPPVQYVRTSDGYDIAYAVSGTGTPIVCLPVGFSDVETRWRHYPRWMEGLAARFQAITYDNVGTGLSTRALPADLSGAGFDRDLAAVIETLRLAKPILLAGAISAGHSAVRYAVANPDRVQALIWNTATVTSAAWPSALFGQLARENRDLFLNSLARGLPESEQKERVHEYGNWITPEAWDKKSSANRAWKLFCHG